MSVASQLDVTFVGLSKLSLVSSVRASGVNLVLIVNDCRNYHFALIRHAVFGLDSFRFAAMLGVFLTNV